MLKNILLSHMTHIKSKSGRYLSKAMVLLFIHIIFCWKDEIIDWGERTKPPVWYNMFRIYEYFYNLVIFSVIININNSISNIFLMM